MTFSQAINEPALVDLSKQLIRTPSPSGSEGAVATILARAMKETGFDDIDSIRTGGLDVRHRHLRR
jgi:putative aminopeptidase FrvX